MVFRFWMYYLSLYILRWFQKNLYKLQGYLLSMREYTLFHINNNNNNIQKHYISFKAYGYNIIITYGLYFIKQLRLLNKTYLRRSRLLVPPRLSSGPPPLRPISMSFNNYNRTQKWWLLTIYLTYGNKWIREVEGGFVPLLDLQIVFLVMFWLFSSYTRCTVVRKREWKESANINLTFLSYFGPRDWMFLIVTNYAFLSVL